MTNIAAPMAANNKITIIGIRTVAAVELEELEWDNPT